MSTWILIFFQFFHISSKAQFHFTFLNDRVQFIHIQIIWRPGLKLDLFKMVRFRVFHFCIIHLHMSCWCIFVWIKLNSMSQVTPLSLLRNTISGKMFPFIQAWHSCVHDSIWLWASTPLIGLLFPLFKANWNHLLFYSHPMNSHILI